MVENRHIVEEDEVENGEEESPSEACSDTLRRILIAQLILYQTTVVAAAAICKLAIEIIQDTTSQESEEESSSHYPSAVTPDQSCKDHEPTPRAGDTYNIRMERVYLWRDTVMKDASPSRSLPLKRKLNSYHDVDENSSHYPSNPSKRPRTTSRSSRYMCSACDTPFTSQPRLRQHARMPHAREACQAAVGYHFE